MKIDWNRRYTTISIYAVLVFLICYSIYKFTNNWDITKDNLIGVTKMLSPFIYAMIIAYFLNPTLKKIETTILAPLKKNKFRRPLAILLVYVLLLGTIILLLSFVLPQLISNLKEIGGLSNTYLPVIQNFLSRDDIEIFNSGYYLDFTIINKYFNDNVVQTFSSVSNLVANLAPLLLNILTDLTSGILNLTLGFIIAIYLLMSKERAMLSSRKLIFALFSPKRAIYLINLSKESNQIFINFIIGKMIDSVIIGILTFIILIVFQYPYALLISVIVGITNMIPYFGPFIGGIIGFALLLFVTPIQALWFLLIIVIIQQFDGNILGPKILGDSTGLSPFWVIFAIILFGSIFGFAGMFFGVPILAVIKNIITRQIDIMYKKRTTDL